MQKIYFKNIQKFSDFFMQIDWHDIIHKHTWTHATIAIGNESRAETGNLRNNKDCGLLVKRK